MIMLLRDASLLGKKGEVDVLGTALRGRARQCENLIDQVLDIFPQSQRVDGVSQSLELRLF